MLDLKSTNSLRIGLLSTVVLTTLLMTPYSSVDPVSLPKMSLVVLASLALLGFWVTFIKTIFASPMKPIFILLLLFIAQMILVLAFSGTGFWLQIYGTYGRNTGVLTYIALTLLLISCVIAADLQFVESFIAVTISVGVLLTIYGQIQNQGWDLFPFANAYGSNVFGTLGNPDFMSAFMGLIGVVAATLALNTRFKFVTRLALSLLALASITTVYETHAKQGYLNFAAGIVATSILWLFMNNKTKLATLASGFAGLGGGLIFLGLINIGPLAHSLYKSSLAARGFYWRAAINMLIHHPFFGVGMDGFGEWYKRARNLQDTLVNPGITSDAAHNVFLDIASNGGFPLIAIYLAILGLVIISVVRVVRRGNGFDVYFVSLAGAWVAYQTQSFVSINQIGLAIWGWVLSGLIIGYEINTRGTDALQVDEVTRKARKADKKVTQALSAATLVSVFAGVLVGALLALPPFIAANKYYLALKSGDALVLQPAAYLKPYERVRFTFVATTFSQNNLNDRAIVVIRDAVKLFPDSSEAWTILAGLPNASPAEVAHAKAEMKRLDPYNPDLK